MGKHLLQSASAHRAPIAIVGPMPPPQGGMALQGQVLRDHLMRESVEVYFLATNRNLPAGVSGWKGVRTLLQTAIYLRDLLRILPRVSVVHVLGASYFYFFSRVMPVLVLARIMGKRVILNYRGGAGPSFFARFGWLARPVVKLADLVTVPSAYLQRCFAAQNIPCRVIPNLIDLQQFKFRHRRTGTARLLVTRNLEAMYNVVMALRAFEIIKKQFPHARLDIVGTGSQETLLKNWVAARRLTDVRFHGAVAHNRISVFLDQADILLNPTRVDNFPMSLVEAFACGLPVVTTDAGGIPDLIGETGAALCVAPDDDQAMADKVRTLLTEPALGTRLAEQGRALAEIFTWPSIKEALFDSYYPTHAPVTFVKAEAK